MGDRANAGVAIRTAPDDFEALMTASVRISF
jgi:hypothetical protein